LCYLPTAAPRLVHLTLQILAVIAVVVGLFALQLQLFSFHSCWLCHQRQCSPRVFLLFTRNVYCDWLQSIHHRVLSLLSHCCQSAYLSDVFNPHTRSSRILFFSFSSPFPCVSPIWSAETSPPLAYQTPVKFLRPRRSEKMPLTSKRLAGPGYIILNVIRAMNITGLLAVIAASVVMVVKTFTVSKVSVLQ
jgi:hypothetical protein